MSNIVKKAIGVLKSPKKRTIILAQRGFFKNMSDEDFLKMQFKNVFGYPLDLDNPKTYSEKLQWLKSISKKSNFVSSFGLVRSDAINIAFASPSKAKIL